MKKLILNCLVVAAFIATGCSEESEPIQPIDSEIRIKSSLSLLDQIERDVESNVSYPYVQNEYGYSSEYWNSFTSQYNFYENLSTKNYETELNNFYNHYESLGFNSSTLEGYSDFIESTKKSSISESIDSLRDNGYIENEEEYDIITYYIDLFLDEKYSAEKFEEITSVFIYHVNQSNLGSLQKRTLLTTFDMASNLQYEIENNGLIGLSKMPDQEIVCAGDIIVGIAAGAILGNGPGAAIGLFTGLWAAYTDGCMD